MKRSLSAYQLVLTALFAALTAIGAFIRIPTPWSSFTLQVFFVFMAGVLLPPRLAFLSQAVYVGLGLIGLPIFTQGGGFGYVFQPTFGFLLSYLPAAAVISLVCGQSSDFRWVILSCLAGLAVIYAVGMPYMGLILNLYLGKDLSLWALLMAGMIPFLPYDALKLIVTAVLAKPLVPALRKLEQGHRH